MTIDVNTRFDTLGLNNNNFRLKMPTFEADALRYEPIRFGFNTNPSALTFNQSLGLDLSTDTDLDSDVETENYANISNKSVSDTERKINQCISTAASLKTRLKSMLRKSGITDEQRDQVNNILDQVIEFEKKLKKLKKDLSETNATKRYKKAKEIEVQLRELSKLTGQIRISGSSASDDDESNGSADGVNRNRRRDRSDRSQRSSSSEFDEKIVDEVEDFFYATEGQLGTDEATLERVVNSINKNNVMDYLCAWNEFQSNKNGNSFTSVIYDETSGDLMEKCLRKIARELRKKATELGLYDSLRSDFANIDKEISDWWYTGSSIKGNFDNIVRVIGEKMGGKYATWNKPQKA